MIRRFLGRGGRYSLPRPVAAVLKLLIVAGLIAEIVAFFVLADPRPSIPPGSNRSSPTAESHAQHMQEEGFSFEAPKAWSVRRAGAIIKLVRPDRAMALSYGQVAKLPVDELAARTTSELRAAYRDLRLGPVLHTRVAGLPALLGKGRATSSNGSRLILRYEVIDGRQATYLATGFVDAYSKDLRSFDRNFGRLTSSFRSPS